MLRNRVAALAAVLAIVGAVACGGAGTEPNPDPGGKNLNKIDPYATFLIENRRTVAGSGKLAANYEINLAWADTLAFQGNVSPGERTCASLSGFVGTRLTQIVGVADTVQELGLTPKPQRDSAALGTKTWSGMVRAATPAFDPLVSADTSRGHTRERPVKWRLSFTDAGNVIVEDSTTACVF